jgi:ABC-2 type transport system permease protein
MFGLFFDTYYVASRELKKYFRQKARIVVSFIQPLVWLVLMGNTMSRLTSTANGSQLFGTSNYLSFMTPGIILMTVMMTSIFSGISIVWDRRIGFLDKLLAAPIKRGAIPFGKMLASAVQGLIQAGIIIVIALLLGVRFQTGFLGVLLIFLIGAMIAFVFGGISLALASKITTMENLQAIINMLTMPLIFSSSAMFPIQVMPHWLQIIARLNPLTYAVNIMRNLVITGWQTNIVYNILILLLVDFIVMLLVNRVFEKAVSE